MNMFLRVRKILQFCVPLLAVATGFLYIESGLLAGSGEKVSLVRELSYMLIFFLPPIVLGYLSPRLFWLIAIGLQVGPFWAETRPLPGGQADGFSSPLAVFIIALVVWLPLALGLTGAGALLHVFVRRFRAKRSKSQIKSIS